MRNRTRNKLRARKRYKRMRNNPVFKRRQRMYRMNPNRFRRIGMNGGFFPIPFWSASMGSGFVVGVDDDEVFYVMDNAPDTVRPMFHQDFLDTAVLFEDTDIDQLFTMMDTAMDVPFVARTLSDVMVRTMEDGDG